MYVLHECCQDDGKEDGKELDALDEEANIPIEELLAR